MTPETLACLVFLWILYLEVCGSLRRFEYAVESESKPGPAYVAGVKFGVVLRYFSLLVTGLFALDGYRAAFVLFALLVIWGAIQSGRCIARDFGTGFQATRGYFPPRLAAFVGVGSVVMTRGLPLVALSYGLRPMWG